MEWILRLPELIVILQTPFGHERSFWLMRFRCICQWQTKCVIRTLLTCSKKKKTVDGEVLSFDFALKNLVCIAHWDWNKKIKSNFYTGFWRGSTDRVADWLWKLYDGETFERSCRLSPSKYILRSNDGSIFGILLALSRSAPLPPTVDSDTKLNMAG